MRLESASRYFSPKSTSISDSPRATASDSLTGTDVMAAFGMCQAKAEFGLRAYLGKVGVSVADRDITIEFLTQFGMRESIKNGPLRRVNPIARVKIIKTIAKFAFKDYCRSAASVECCECCGGKGLIKSTRNTGERYYFYTSKVTDKRYESASEAVDEEVLILCKKCNGKGAISVACNDCRGRGIALDRELTERQGVPVHKPCKRCTGRGYERLPSSDAFRAVKCFVPELSQASWSRNIKPLYDDMITKCHQEESFADSMLSEVTR